LHFQFSNLQTRNLKTNGIILRKTNYAEADRIFVILTKEFGKISAIAKGVRKVKSKLGGHLEFFSKINFEFYKSSNNDLYRINEAESVVVNKNIVQNLELMKTSYKIIRLINQFTEENYPLPKILNLSIQSFNCLNKDQNPDLILLTFQVKFFTILGYLPSFDHCVKCREKLQNSINYFDFNNLGIVCKTCLSEISLNQEISFPLIKTLNFVQKANFEQILKIKLEKNDFDLLENLVEKVVEKIEEK